jgi:hypothetical protein
VERAAVGLARQAVAIFGGGALLVGAIYSGVGEAPRVNAARQSIEPPIWVQSVELAPPAASVPVAAIAAPQSMKTPRRACASSSCARPAASKAQHPPPASVERTSAPVAVAPVAPEPDRSLKNRLFAPVGAFRDQVARLISWP